MRQLFLAAVAVCATLMYSSAGLALEHTVLVGGSADLYNPETLTVTVGDRITFRNEGGIHNVAADDGSFRCSSDCAGIAGGTGTPSAANWAFVLQVNVPGTLGYHCDTHGAAGTGMHGTINVITGPTPVTIGPGFTGAWYDPQQAGHGIFMEVLPDGRLLAWWFTFAPDGSQAWFGGTGPIQGNQAVVRADLTTGGHWIPNFDNAQIVNNPWGTLTFTFNDCNHGRVDFASSYPGYDSGSMNLTRLTMPAGQTCP